MKRIDFLKHSYSNKKVRIGLHLLFWIIMFGSYYYFNTISFNPARGTPATWLLAAKNAIEFAAAFYLLMYWIWPQFFAKKKWIKGIALLLLWTVAFAALDAWADQRIFGQCRSCGERLKTYHPDYHASLQRNFPSIVFVRVISGGLLNYLVIQLSFPIAIKIGRDYFRQTVQQLQLSRENLQLEFNFLKAQVNPHFLFNTLNNIYSLVMSERKEQAGQTIARLSGLMRYTLYETGDDKILLLKEIRLLQDYVELEKMRLNETGVSFHFETDSETYVIPPLLLMPALENAFKYATDRSGSEIRIDVNACKDKLAVKIRNSFAPSRPRSTGGIGLQNFQKRLRHYYPQQASYNATVTNDVYLFQVELKLS